MIKKIKKILIVGGGTAGWLTAAYLRHNLNKKINIVLVDSPTDSTVGVGEATILNFSVFFKSCGFKIDEWFYELDATIKNGILFKNWNNNDIWHPFDFNYKIDKLNLWSNCQNLDFKKYATNQYESSIEHNSIDLNYKNSWGFHVDCKKLVNFIKNKININYINSKIIKIDKNDNNINFVTLENKDDIKADLYIDCSGFKKLLNKSDIINLENRLHCDTAIAGHVLYKNKERELTPFVISEAVDYGWIWKIPIKDRIGTGIVFNRSITDIEETKLYFNKHWDNRIYTDLKVLDWTPYFCKNIFNGNVVSIGLSAGFIEPLESTGIALIMEGIVQLYFSVKNEYYDENIKDMYNCVMRSFFENSIDFINMHYSNINRNGIFWKNIKNKKIINNTLEYYIDLMKEEEPLMFKENKFSFFTSNNWYIWLIQLKYKLNKKNLQNYNLKDSPEKLLISNYSSFEKNRYLRGLNHYKFIDQIYKNKNNGAFF